MKRILPLSLVFVAAHVLLIGATLASRDDELRRSAYRRATSSKIWANSTAPGFLISPSMRPSSARSSSMAVFSRTMELRWWPRW